jgi:spore germination protein GerM
VAAVVAGAALAAACGVPSEQAPRAISSADVPFGLLDAVGTTTTTASLVPELQPGVAVTVYLLDREGFLLPVGRRAAVGGPVDVLRSLLEGPRPEESAAGLRSALPVATELLGFRTGPETGAAIVDLSDDFLTVQGEQQIKAVAQVVLTLTELPGITGVRFAFEGQVRPVFRAQGDLTDAPLTRSSFTQLTAAGRATGDSVPTTEPETTTTGATSR